MYKVGRLIPVLTFLVTVLLISCSDDSNPAGNDQNGFTPDGMVLIHSNGQSFSMGSEVGNEDERPVHTVNFTYDFWMDTTEVTQGNYDSLMSTYYVDYLIPLWSEQFGLGDNYPAYEVYWGDAVLYCNARSRRDGLDTIYTYTSILGTPGSLCELEDVEIDLTKNGYRLPTEAEFEFACKGGVDADFYWGKDYGLYPANIADTSEISQNAIWYANSWVYGSESLEYGTHPVASKAPNGYNLYDMAGNLYEWCNDWYGEYNGSDETDPTGPETGDWRSVRGGSWGSNAIALRSTNRTFDVPGYMYYHVGFRIALPVQ